MYSGDSLSSLHIPHGYKIIDNKGHGEQPTSSREVK